MTALKLKNMLRGLYRTGRRMRVLLLSGFVLCSLVACEGLLESVLTIKPPDLYTLTPKSTFAESLPEVNWQLVVEEPIASGGLNSDRIALRSQPIEIKYFADANWTVRVPRMVQTLIVESFENSHKIVAVGRQAVGLRSDFNLKSELREFQAEYTNDDTSPPTIRVRVNAKLVQQPRREIIASHNFEAKVQANSTRLQDIIFAFDDALGKVMRHLVEWTLTKGYSATRAQTSALDTWRSRERAQISSE